MTPCVAAPALHRAAALQGAGVAAAEGECDDVAGEAGDGARRAALVEGAVAELAGVVAAPAGGAAGADWSMLVY